MARESLAEFKKRAEEKKQDHLARLREHYQYARSLGFSVEEAHLLQGRSKERIDQLAEERKQADG